MLISLLRQKRFWFILLLAAGTVLTVWFTVMLLRLPSGSAAQTSTAADFFIATMLEYGPVFLGLGVFIGALGVPLPALALMIASGAFARQGLLDIRITPVVALLGLILGDSSAFAVGHFARHWLEQRFGASGAWRAALDTFGLRTGILTFLTRFWFTPLRLPFSLLAGVRTPYHRFLPYDVLGNFLWVMGFLLAGYYFPARWQQIASLAYQIIGLSLGLLALLGALLIARSTRKSR